VAKPSMQRPEVKTVKDYKMLLTRQSQCCNYSLKY
jgi:hypothetical protein